MGRWRTAVTVVACAAFALAAAGVAIGAFSDAVECERGDNCIEPAMTYFVIGMPAVVLAGLAILGASMAARRRGLRRWPVAATLAGALAVAVAGAAIVVNAPR